MKLKHAGASGAALFAAPAAMILAAGPAAAANSPGVAVSNTETVQVFMDPSGGVDVARVYEQIAMEGKGTVQLANPVETRGLRNLDGFGNPRVENGEMVGTYKVDGQQRIRTVSDFTKTLPLDVQVTYLLDGKEVEAKDIVGKDGMLEVRYTVRNMTGKPQDVSFDDGTGNEATATDDIVIPMVGSLTTVLPSNFTDVSSGQASMAGDGRGGMKMTYTMTLFGPIGSPEASFGYKARITDGVVPTANISALPVNPLESPSFKGAAASYQGGAETGITLTQGATTIDTNLLKLRDGAGKLLAGLIQLRNGATELNSGLSGTAVPGARKLADGAGQASSGASQLSSGLTKLDDGANKLSGGTSTLADGSGQLAKGAGRLAGGASDARNGADQLAGGSAQVAEGLDTAGAQAPQLIGGLELVADGLDQLDAGLVELYGGIGDLPAKAKPIHEGIDDLLAGLGNESKQGTIIYGVHAVNTALAGTAVPGIDQLIASAFSTSSQNPGSYQRLDCAQQILTDVVDGTLANGTAGTTSGCYASTTNPSGQVPVLKGLTDTPDFAGPGLNEMSKSVTSSVRNSLKSSLSQIVADPKDPNAPNDTTLVGGLNKLKIGIDSHKPGKYGPTDPGGAQYALTAVGCGLDNGFAKGCDPEQPGLMQGLGQVDAGVSQLVNGVVGTVQGAVGESNDTSGDRTLRGGVHSLQAGVDQIGVGGVALLDGLDRLSAGAGVVAGGNASLADGLKTLSGGASDLSSGATKLDSGANQLAGGANQLAAGTGTANDGAAKLADGNSQLADGANKLADGLGDAAAGSGKLADGLVTAADSAPALEDGAQRLSDEGTKKIIAAGQATAADYGEKYAALQAGAERAQTDGMAYGAPEGASGATAYSFELAGAKGEAGSNVGRALGAAAVFGLAGGAVLLRRRLS